MTGALKINNKSLRGDLDNIVLKSLQKDPERRYQTVEQFGEDIERYLKGLPVSARPDTVSYRAAKFFERNRAVVISFGLMMMLLGGGVFGTTWQAVRAARQQKIAEARFAQVRELANNVIFKYHDSIANLSGSTEARKTLVEDATKYLDGLAQDSDADENLQNELALAYAKLADVQGKPYSANTGDAAAALENYGKSIKLLEGLTASTDAVIRSRAEEELVTAYHGYSSLNSRIFNFDEAVSSQKKALDLANKNLALDSPDLRRRITFARAGLWLGDAYSEAGNFTEAVNYYRRAAGLAEEIYRSAPDEKDAETILGVSYDRLGRGLLLRGQELSRTDFSPAKISEIYRESYAYLEKTFELFKKVADENPDNQKYQRNLVVAQSNLGMVLRNVGEFDRSLEVLKEVTAKTENNIKSDMGNRELEANHAEDLHQLALTLNAKNEFAKAVEKLESALQTMNKLIAKDADNIEFRRSWLEMTGDYGNLFFKRRDFKSALKIYQTALQQNPDSEKLSAGILMLFAEGMMNENIGDCYAQAALDSSASKIERETNLKKSETYYRNADNLWQRPDVRRSFFSRTPEMLDYLHRKISRVNQRKGR